MRTPPSERWLALASFARARWGAQLHRRAALEAWQRASLNRWLAKDLPRARRYTHERPKQLEDLPIVNKAQLLASFASYNAHEIDLATAIDAARRDEDASAAQPLNANLAFGLSSGTSGSRCVFITNGAERATWLGILLARALPVTLLTTLALGARPLRVALFLRANNRLYTTLASRRIDFRFFGLDRGVEPNLPALVAAAPDVIVAPASVLAWLARRHVEGGLAIEPRRLISVAEVLEPDDETMIERAFGLPVHQLYQCTEGFLGATCEAGTIHLNEDFVHIEREWLDAERTRFVPIVTDFTRSTQIVARLRLDDVLRVKMGGCSCGSPLLAIDRIEGRCDDVLWLPASNNGALRPIFPDTIRHAIAKHVVAIGDYRVVQHGNSVGLATLNPSKLEDLRFALESVFQIQGVVAPPWTRLTFDEQPTTVKRRRIRCASRVGFTCDP